MAGQEADPSFPGPDDDPLGAVEVLPPAEEPIDYHDEEQRQRVLRLQVVDQSHGVHHEAADAADEYINEQTTQRGVKGFLKKIWVGNLARDYIRQREITRGRREITESDNLYTLSGGTEDQYRHASEEVVGRFTDGLLHEGESNENAEDVAGGERLRDGLNDLIRSYARGDLTDASFEDEKNRLVRELGQELHSFDRNRGLLLADNAVLVARHARAAFEHGVGLDNIEKALSVQVGEARMGVRTEASKELVDRMADRIYSTRVGSVVNETTLALGASVVMSMTKAAGTRGISMATRTVGIGFGAGIIAGVREWHHTAQERRLHSREMAEGGVIDLSNDRRRARMETTRYETERSTVLTERLRQAQEAYAAGPDPEKARALLAAIARAQTRIGMSDQLSRDLIQYTSKMHVEQERHALDAALAEAKVALRHIVDSSDDDALRDLTGDVNRDVEEVVSARCTYERGAIEGDMSHKDAAFRKLRLSRAASAAAVGATVGIMLGEAVQGVEHLAVDLSGGHAAALVASGDHSSTLHGVNADFDHSSFHQGNGAIDLPPGYHVVQGAGGNELMGPDNHAIGQIAFDDRGHLTAASQHMLQQHGFTLHSATETYDTTHTVTSTHDLSYEQYMKAHPDRFAPIHRQFWYDENTPKPHFELNELKLEWGGNGASGIDANGNYVFDVSHMTAGGSFHDGYSANAQELIKDHKLFIAISGTKGTQFNVIYVPINEHGQAVFNPHDPLFRSLFSTENGHAHFNGAYAEVVQDMGKTSDGGMSVRMLATVVGDNHPHAVQEAVQTVVRSTGEHVVTHADVTQALPHMGPEIVPAVLPLRSRTGLEALHQGANGGPAEESGYYLGGYYGKELGTHYERWRSERSPRLRMNPDVQLDTGEELAWYRNEQINRRGQEYVDEIDSNVRNSDVLSKVGNETKAVVCIPVAAVNESDNIFKTLSLYAQQGKDAVAGTVILLNLNWKKDAESDPEALAKIQRTHDEIRRAQAAFPQLRIATFDKVWTPDFIQRRTDEHGNVKMYGEVIKVLYDTAAFALGHAVQDGRRASQAEAVLITNDADAQGMNRRYLNRYIEALEQHPTVDVMSGAIRWGTREYANYPGYGLASGFYAVVNMLTQRGQNRGVVSTTGPNAGFRMSVYAATGGCEDDDRQGAGADAVLGQRVLFARRESVPMSSVYGNTTAYASQYGHTSSPRMTSGNREVSMHIGGAQIDTLGDRLLGAYRQGRWIAAGWNGFDNGGYEDRSVSASKGNLAPENPAKDIDGIAERLKINVEGFINSWYRDAGMATGALALYIGTKDEKGRPLYTAWWDGRPGWGEDCTGRFHFDLTKAGKTWLQKRLLKDTRGRRDPYGARLRRKLYSEREPGDKHQVLAIPRFVAHTN